MFFVNQFVQTVWNGILHFKPEQDGKTKQNKTN